MSAVLPSQSQLLLPLLNVLGEHGPLRAKDACRAVAEKINLGPEARDAQVTYAGGLKCNVWERRVRWTRQSAVMSDLIADGGRGVWRLTETGERTDLIAKPSVVITVYQTANGALLWADAKSAVQYIEDGSVTCALTSPPYPLVKPRDYDLGMVEWAPENYIDTLLDHIQLIRPKLSTDGTFVLNLGPAFLPGQPARNPYQHRIISSLVDRLNWSLVDEHVWFSPTKPRTSNHVTRTRTHCVNALENIFLLSPTGRTKCSNLRVLQPYTDRQKRLIEAGGEVVRHNSPSLIQTPGIRHTRMNEGAIPTNLHTLSPDRDAAYRAYCKANGLPEHPAMMPIKLAEFFIELTTEPGDTVFDMFGGSAKVGEAAWKLDRRFIISERRLDYLRGAMCRFPESAQSPLMHAS